MSGMIAPLDFFATDSAPSAASPSRLRTTVTEWPKEMDSPGCCAIASIADAETNSKVKFQGPEAWLHVYDLNGTKGANNTLHPLGLGLFHAGLEVYGVEWSFGGALMPPGHLPVTGIHSMPPRSCPGATYRESISLGAVPHSAEEVWQILLKLAVQWLATAYHPLKRNCLNFCSEFATALAVQDVPSWVGRLALAADILLSPVVGVLDAFNALGSLDAAPVDAVLADEDARQRQLPVTSEACDTTCDLVPVLPENEQSPSAIETAVVQDFFEQFDWANTQMAAEHRLWEEQLEQKRLQCLLAFL